MGVRISPVTEIEPWPSRSATALVWIPDSKAARAPGSTRPGDYRRPNRNTSDDEVLQPLDPLVKRLLVVVVLPVGVV